MNLLSRKMYRAFSKLSSGAYLQHCSHIYYTLYLTKHRDRRMMSTPFLTAVPFIKMKLIPTKCIRHAVHSPKRTREETGVSKKVDSDSSIGRQIKGKRVAVIVGLEQLARKIESSD